jgi:mono/diheme cytochrome c family protein
MAEQGSTSKVERVGRGMARPPFWLVAVLLILVVATWVPLVVIAWSRVSASNDPRVQVFQDMGTQPKYTAQAASGVFADGRAMRGKIAGTVARGQLQEDDHYYRGFSQKWNEPTGKWEVTFFEGLPRQVTVNEKLLRRGQERFNIYCASCHGMDGYGGGTVAVRAREIGQDMMPANLHDALARDRADGHIYNTINNGIRRMPGHGSQIAVEDRWAIVAYVRALQLSQNAPVRLVPPERLETLR